MPKEVFISKGEMAELEKANNIDDMVFAGKEVIFPNPAFPKQSEFCRLRMEGLTLFEIQEQTGISEDLCRRYNYRFKPFILKKLVDLKDKRKGEALLIIQEQIKKKQREMEAHPEKDKSDLLDWVKVEMGSLDKEPPTARPQGNQPIIQIIDNREQIKPAEVIDVKGATDEKTK